MVSKLVSPLFTSFILLIFSVSFQRCIPPPEEKLKVEKIPFDPEKKCEPEFEIQLGREPNYYTPFDFVFCTDGNLVLVGGEDRLYPENLEKGDSLTERKWQNDTYIEKRDKEGKLLWKKSYVLDPAYDDGIDNVQVCKEGGFIASAHCFRYIKNEYGDSALSIDKIIFRFDNNGDLLWKAGFDDMQSDRSLTEKAIETNAGNFLIWGSQLNNDDNGEKKSDVVNIDAAGKIISQFVFNAKLEEIRYEKNTGPDLNDFSMYRIESGKTYNEERLTRNDESGIVVTKSDEKAKVLWKNAFFDKRFFNNIVPTGKEYISVADTGGILIVSRGYSVEAKNREDGKTLWPTYINLIRIGNSKENTWTRTFEIDNYNEPFAAIKVRNGWRIAGLSGVQTSEVSGRCMGGSLREEFEGEKKFFIAELDDLGNIKEVKSFYNGSEISSARLTNDGIIFIAGQYLVKAKW